jgi:hypothetical protein
MLKFNKTIPRQNQDLIYNMGTQYAFGQIVTDGLVLCLNASDRNSYVSGSTTWNDVSGRGNNGTLTNGPTFNSANGGSIVFDGVDDYASVPYTTNFDATVNGITLNTWVYNNNSSGGWKAVIQRNRNGTLAAVYGIWRSTSNGWQFRLGSGGVDSTINITNATTGIWVNLTLTYNKTTLIAYINGVNVGTNTPIGYVNDTQNLLIGDAGVSEYFKGGIASTQIYNRALSQSEVLQNYNAYKTRFGLT